MPFLFKLGKLIYHIYNPQAFGLCIVHCVGSAAALFGQIAYTNAAIINQMPVALLHAAS